MGRLIELIAIVCIVAILSIPFWPSSMPPLPMPPPDPVASSTPEHRAAPAFNATRLNGWAYWYSGKTALFIVLTAIDCKACRERVPLDRRAVALVKKQLIPVVDILIYADLEKGREFARVQHPEADYVVVDPDGGIGVGKYGGSDDNVWFLVDHSGHIVWHGGPDISMLERHLGLMKYAQ